MAFYLEYPLCMFLQQLHWAQKNKQLRPAHGSQGWGVIANQYRKEIREYLKEKGCP